MGRAASGKYQQTLEPGFSLIIPFVDRIAYKVTTKDIVLDIPSQEVITRDNVVIIANAVAYINIIRPDKAVYGIEDYEHGIRNLVQTSLRSIIGEIDIDNALSSRDEIKTLLKQAISEDIADWGITLKTVEIQDINPSQTMQASMEEQAAAERLRRATVTRADGQNKRLYWKQMDALKRHAAMLKRRWYWPEVQRSRSVLLQHRWGMKRCPLSTYLESSTSSLFANWRSLTTQKWWCCQQIS